MTNFDKRPRGRNNRRNGRRNYGSRSSQVIKLNDTGRGFSQQRVKFNGNASKLFEKYKKLAAEALSIMNSKKITALCVFKSNRKKVSGLITVHKILNANIS